MSCHSKVIIVGLKKKKKFPNFPRSINMKHKNIYQKNLTFKYKPYFAIILHYVYSFIINQDRINRVH